MSDSKIQKALAEATDVEPSKRKNETITSQDYLKRLTLAVADLPDAEWDKLPTAAQDWYNTAADAIEAKKDVPEFPDLPKAEPPTSRRRGAESSKEEASSEPKVGDTVQVVTKRGREYEGKVVEIQGDDIVLDVDGKDVELEISKLEKMTVVAGGSTVEVEDDAAGDPAVGDTVQVVTKRGKTVMGKVTEITEDDLVMTDAAGEIHEFARDKLTSMEVKARGDAAVSTSSSQQKPRSGGDAPKKEAKDTAPAATGAKRVSSSANGGVSVTVRMRELICADLAAKKEDIAAQLKKEGLEFKQATLDLTFSDAHRLIQILRDQKKLK